MTYARFSKKLGLPPSTLHRLEQGAQSITLRGLQQIMRRLKCGLTEIFPESGSEVIGKEKKPQMARIDADDSVPGIRVNP
jgi:transcriptional regulator with XRE-family HTH domain